MSSRRQKQVNQTIRREISDLLRRQVSDPRINSGILSITEVDISPDLKQAKIHVSIMGTEQEKAETLSGLASASDFLRRELGGRIRLRHTPRLMFEIDDSLEKAEYVLQLIDQTAAESPED